MSDFLNNVIAKNLNFAPVIQPRLPSLFEPPRAAGKWFAGYAAGSDELETAPLRTEHAADFPEPAITAASPGIASRRPAAQLLPMAQDEFPPLPDTMKITMIPEMRQPPGQLLQLSRPILSPPVGTGLETSPIRNVLDSASMLTPPQPFSNLQPTVSESHPITGVAPMVRANEAPWVPPRRDENGTRLRNATEQPRQHAPESPVVERIVAPGEPQPLAVASKAPSVIVQPQIKRYVKPILPTPAKSVEKPEPAPTIQVTIGRIEVRATPPSPPSRKQTSVPSIMSLEEYLRRRQGGGA